MSNCSAREGRGLKAYLAGVVTLTDCGAAK